MDYIYQSQTGKVGQEYADIDKFQVSMCPLMLVTILPMPSWASYEIRVRKIAGCACAGNVGNAENVFFAIAGCDLDMHHGTCVTHVPWYMPSSLTSGFFWSRWRGKHFRYSQGMHNPQFYIFGKIIGVSQGVISKVRSRVRVTSSFTRGYVGID